MRPLPAAFLIATWAQVTFAATITVSPDAGYQPVEAAQAGDEVVFEPGVYRYRLAILSSGTPGAPLVFRAADPLNPPVFDYSGADLLTFPGSNAGFFADRAAWDVSGSDVEFRSIVIRGVESVGSIPGAAIRFSSGDRHRVIDLKIEGCEGGLENVGGALLVENSRFDRNRVHFNVFGGGPLTVRGNLLTDALEWNFFHVGGDATFEANWMSNSSSFAGLVGACAYNCGGTGTQPKPRAIAFRGNVFVQNPNQAPNTFFFLGLVDDGSASADGSGLTQPDTVTLSHNTFVGRVPTPAAAVVLNSAPIHQLSVQTWSNAWAGFGLLFAQQAASATPYSGAGDWATQGTDTSGLTSVVLGAPEDLGPTYRPVEGRSLFGATATPADQRPGFEYAGDGSSLPRAVPRAGFSAAGAFETSVLPVEDAGVSDAGSGSEDGGVDGLATRRLRVGCSVSPDGLEFIAAFAWFLRRRPSPR